MTTQITVRQSSIRPIGGSTVLLDLGGVRLIVDPTFDAPDSSPDGMPTRTTAPAIAADDVGHLDAALVSHDQHPDNLDQSGRALLTRVPVVLTTQEGAGRLGGQAHGLTSWDTFALPRPDSPPLRVTAVPAQHGPPGAEAQSGPVTGFVLTADDLPTIYISGDNASLGIVREIAERTGGIDVAVLFVGAATVTQMWDGAPLTLTSAQAATAAELLGARSVIPVHCDGWTHYTEGSAAIAAAFASAGLTHVLTIAAPGTAVSA